MEITITFDTVEEADNVGRSLRVDDDDFVETRIDGFTVSGRFRGRSLDGLRRASDDWMACLSATMKKIRD